MKISCDVAQIQDYINWTYFFHAWSVKEGQDEAAALKADAEGLLRQWHSLKTSALFLLADCHSEDDDIVLADGARLPMLRQQQPDANGHCLCLADFINPRGDKVGLFGCTCDAPTDGDCYTSLLQQTVADRLAEATAEWLHTKVRRELWGYAPDERLTMKELHAERFQGIRPAVGYPALPDQSLNFVLDDILDLRQIGITLTENGAMRPHASVSGLMIAHPQARYFAVGRVGEDQLHDYASRRGLEADYLRPFLGL